MLTQNRKSGNARPARNLTVRFPDAMTAKEMKNGISSFENAYPRG